MKVALFIAAVVAILHSANAATDSGSMMAGSGSATNAASGDSTDISAMCNMLKGDKLCVQGNCVDLKTFCKTKPNVNCDKCVPEIKKQKAAVCKNPECLAPAKQKEIEQQMKTDTAKFCANTCKGTFVQLADSTSDIAKAGCSSMFSDGRRGLPNFMHVNTARTTGRRLLGGKAMSDKDTLEMKNFCVKNKSGLYCMPSDKLMESALKKANIDPKSTKVPSCDLQKKFWASAGCCVGTITAITAASTTAPAAPKKRRSDFMPVTRRAASGYASGYASASSYASGTPPPPPSPPSGAWDTQDFQSLLQNADKCGIKVNYTPCNGGSAYEIARIPATIKLSGISAAQFTTAVQNEFKAGVAKTAGVGEKAITIVSFKDTRRSGVTVNYEVLVVTTGGASAASKAGDIQKKLQNKSELQKNIQAQAGTTSPLKTASVSSATASSAQVSGTDGTDSYTYDSAGLAAWLVAVIVISVTLCVCIPLCAFLCCFGGLACLGIGVAASQDSVTGQV